MRRAVVVANADHQHLWGRAFGDGLERHGWSVEVSRVGLPCDLLVLWGTRKQWEIERQKLAGGAVCILERGYVGDRRQWTSVSFGGGLNNRGQFYGPFEDGRRLATLHPDALREGPTSGRMALICGQVPTDMSLRGWAPAETWLRMARELRALGYRPVAFRPHPVAAQDVPGGIGRAPEGSLSDLLRSASICVAINSNSTVESVLAGVPTAVFDDRAMAWPVAARNLKSRVAPVEESQRLAWARSLVWKQWSLDELREGHYWEIAKCHGLDL